jgi:hypothetical protein
VRSRTGKINISTGFGALKSCGKCVIGSATRGTAFQRPNITLAARTAFNHAS